MSTHVRSSISNHDLSGMLGVVSETSIKSGWSIVHIEESQVIISHRHVFLSLRIYFVLTHFSPMEFPTVINWTSLFPY